MGVCVCVRLCVFNRLTMALGFVASQNERRSLFSIKFNTVFLLWGRAVVWDVDRSLPPSVASQPTATTSAVVETFLWPVFSLHTFLPARRNWRGATAFCSVGGWWYEGRV